MRFAFLIEPPFCFRDAASGPDGCDVHLAKLVLERLDLSVDFVEAEFSDLLPGLELGRWEVTTGLFVTSERQELALFSRPIWALADGLLVRKDVSFPISGYRSIAEYGLRLAVIQDQVQHQTALELGVSSDSIVVCGTYLEAAQKVLEQQADAYASVARAHAGFLALNPSLKLKVVDVTPLEKTPAFGAFAFRRSDAELVERVNSVLSQYLGTAEHRSMMSNFGFKNTEIDLISE